MAAVKLLYVCFMLFLWTILISRCKTAYGHRGRCRHACAGGSMMMPSRRCLMDLQTFKTKVAGTIWRPFYYGSTRPESTTFFQGEYFFYFAPNGTTLITEFSGELPDGTCVDETSFENAVGLIPKHVISSKAEFLADSYRVYVSSDPDSYLIFIECMHDKPMRKCPVDDYWIIFMVKDPRPDSLPLQLALNDIYQATCLTIDDTPGDFRFIYLFGENICPSPGE